MQKRKGRKPNPPILIFWSPPFLMQIQALVAADLGNKSFKNLLNLRNALMQCFISTPLSSESLGATNAPLEPT